MNSCIQDRFLINNHYSSNFLSKLKLFIVITKLFLCNFNSWFTDTIAIKKGVV